jgi:hypothetical protein
MPIPKTLLNDAQVDLAKQWLPDGSHPYAYSTKGMLWYWQTHPTGLPVKNALKLSDGQLQQLNQLG